MKEIIVDGEAYVKKSEINEPIVEGDLKIAILQRGFVFIGRFERNGSDCKLHNAYCIRRWGTNKGLGQLALEGKQPETKLDKAGLVEFDNLTIVALINCKEDLWKNEL
jgi:hypothetical protein